MAILAVVGQNKEAVGQVSEGRQLAKASFWVSIVGIIIGAAALALGVYFGIFYDHNHSCTYNYYGQLICNDG